jgi:hypothetical protein
MFSYKEGRLAYEDSEIEVRTNPNDPEGYSLLIKGPKKILSFPRDGLEAIALANRDKAKNLVIQSIPSFIEEIICEEGLLDPIISAVTKTYIKEKINKRL